MKSIDIHAHLVPKSLWQAADAGREWYGFRHEPGDGLGTMLGGERRTAQCPTLEGRVLVQLVAGHCWVPFAWGWSVQQAQ